MITYTINIEDRNGFCVVDCSCKPVNPTEPELVCAKIMRARLDEGSKEVAQYLSELGGKANIVEGKPSDIDALADRIKRRLHGGGPDGEGNSRPN
jgi:hypothetical protein